MSEKSTSLADLDKSLQDQGISVGFEKMPNGELRFRLKSSDGSAYIRTESSESSGWQNSHYHHGIQETYIVQQGWMVLAEWIDNAVVFTKFTESQITTTKPMVPHNVYLPASTVIHTVKHGSTSKSDWHSFEELDRLTKNICEDELLDNARPAMRKSEDLTAKFSSYVDIYNNLDGLIWKIPGFFVAIIAFLLGFIGSVVSSAEASLPSSIWAILFAFAGMLLLLGTYSMYRLRVHHSKMGNELQMLETDGYFHKRTRTTKMYWPPSAPFVFMTVFSILGITFLLISLSVLRKYQWVNIFLS